MKVEGTKELSAAREVVWQVLNDPAQMAKLMPGVEGFEIKDDRHWQAKVKIPLGLGGLRMTIDFEKIEEREPEFAQLNAKGNGVGAIMNMQTQFNLAENGTGTTMRWEADVKIAGPVGAMGQRVLQPIINQQVGNVLGALEKQVSEAAAAGTGGKGTRRAEATRRRTDAPDGRVPLSRDLQLSHDVHAADNVPQALFVQRVLAGGYPVLRTENWTTSATELADVGEPLLLSLGANGAQAVFEEDGVLSVVGFYGGGVFASVAASSAEALEERFARLREAFPPPDPVSTHEVTVTFWTYSRHGPMPSWRSIAVPEWNEIAPNYTASTRAALEGLMQGFRPAHGGQLVLWHGEAGTGKTFALRALAWEWRNWCSLHYIVDPDSFFGQHADYLMNVLMQPGPEGMQVVQSRGWSPYGGEVSQFELMAELQPEENGDGGGPAERGWRLLVLEDTGELLTPDAKTVIGQGLSRFLNVVDGLIGQGLRVLVLVTTNEEIRKLHPAVARPGRCAANIAFTPLSREEAAAWLSERGAGASVSEQTTIASLYALAEDDSSGPSPSVGFGD